MQFDEFAGFLRPERASRFSEGQRPSKRPTLVWSPERAARIARITVAGRHFRALILTHSVRRAPPCAKAGCPFRAVCRVSRGLLGNMKKLLSAMRSLPAFLLCILCVLCAGCDRGKSADTNMPALEKNDSKPAFYINPDEVSYILVHTDFGSSEDAHEEVFTNSAGIVIERHYEVRETFRITNHCEIVEIAREFNDLHKKPEGALTFSGVLSSQLFISTNNTALADMYIIMNPASVCVHTPEVITKNGRFFRVLRYSDSGDMLGLENSMCVLGRQYTAKILEKMEAHSPDVLNEINKFFWKDYKAILHEELSVSKNPQENK
jgi:hypothetical protein